MNTSSIQSATLILTSASRFHPFAFHINEKRKRRGKAKKERSSGFANTKSKLPLSSLYRVVEFSAIFSPSSQLSLPVIYPLAALPSVLVKVNNTPTFCASRRVRFLSKWIHDKFLFWRVKRARACCISRSSLSLSLSPLFLAITDGRPFSFFRQSMGHATMLNVTV